MICKICGDEETSNPDKICNDCRVSIFWGDGIPPDVDNLS